MDIYKYINSKDVRKHLQDLKYQFTSMESAWIIEMCKSLTCKEKINLWKQIMDEMEDNTVYFSNQTFFEWLSNYIKAIEIVIDRFYAYSDDFVYMYSYHNINDNSLWTEEFHHVFKTLDQCKEDFEEDIDEIDIYQIKKQSLKDQYNLYWLEFNNKHEVIKIHYHGNNDEFLSEMLNWSFEQFWFQFPLPFKKGDIVHNPYSSRIGNFDCGSIFIFDGATNTEDYKYLSIGDYTDMVAFGYCVNEIGSIYTESCSGYMDLEFYNGPFVNEYKILPALSKYFKNEIDLSLLLCLYRKNILDLFSNDVMLTNWFSPDKIKELGF